MDAKLTDARKDVNALQFEVASVLVESDHLRAVHRKVQSVVRGLLDVIDHLVFHEGGSIVRSHDDLLFKLVFRVGDRIAIKRALQVLEDMSCPSCPSRETAGSTSDVVEMEWESTSSSGPGGFEPAATVADSGSGS